MGRCLAKEPAAAKRGGHFQHITCLFRFREKHCRPTPSLAHAQPAVHALSPTLPHLATCILFSVPLSAWLFSVETYSSNMRIFSLLFMFHLFVLAQNSTRPSLRARPGSMPSARPCASSITTRRPCMTRSSTSRPIAYCIKNSPWRTPFPGAATGSWRDILRADLIMLTREGRGCTTETPTRSSN